MSVNEVKVLPEPRYVADAEPVRSRMARAPMPASMFRYIAQVSGRHQIWLVLFSAVIFLLTMGPLELQRRIVNSTLESAAMHQVALLCAAYAALVIIS